MNWINYQIHKLVLRWMLYALNNEQKDVIKFMKSIKEYQDNNYGCVEAFYNVALDLYLEIKNEKRIVNQKLYLLKKQRKTKQSILKTLFREPKRERSFEKFLRRLNDIQDRKEGEEDRTNGGVIV